MLKVPVASRRGDLTRHRSFIYDRPPQARGDNVVSPQKGALSQDSKTVLTRHESFLLEKEKTFFRVKEPLLGKRVKLIHLFIYLFL